jgi:EAL domain-containing protein (putative c-di-GMP-specific phosphodiesterase class I)
MRNEGCTEVEGYFLSTPQPGTALHELVERRSASRAA